MNLPLRLLVDKIAVQLIPFHPSKAKRYLLTIILLVASPLAGCQALVNYTCVLGHPNDAEMITTWQENRADFDELIQDFLHDKSLEIMADSWMQPATLQEAQIDEARITSYRQRFQLLHTPYGLRSYGNKDQIWLISSICGLSVSGSAKGYLYLQNGHSIPEWGKLIEGDLDAYIPPDGRSYDVYRHLDDGWYLYYSYED